jgi:hypothetical protein
MGCIMFAVMHVDLNVDPRMRTRVAREAAHVDAKNS